MDRDNREEIKRTSHHDRYVDSYHDQRRPYDHRDDRRDYDR